MPADPHGAIIAARLSGRTDELAAASRLLDDVYANGLRLLLVEGVGGIGKSRLLAEVTELARRRGVAVLPARARRSAQTPFAGADQLLRNLLDPAGAEALFQLPAEVDGPLVSADARRAWARRLADLACAAADAMAALAAGASYAALVLLDDLQWFDPSSQDLLARMVDEITDRHPQARLLLVGATRPPVLGAEPGELHRALAASARGRRLFLHPLTEPDDADLVRSVVPDAGVPYLDLVRRSSRGNPLQTLAVISVLQRRGVPGTVAASDPRITRAATISVPSSAAVEADEPLRQMLGQLGPDGADLLGRLALFATEFSVADAAAVAAWPESDVADRFDRAVATHLLETDGASYWFAHDRLAEVAAGGLRPTARQETHRRSAERLSVLRATGVGGLDVEIGRQHLLGDDPAVTPDVWQDLVRAGDSCHAAGAWEDAGHFFERALALIPPAGAGNDTGAGPGADTARRLPIALKAGMAHYYRQDVPATERCLHEAVALARQVDDPTAWCTAAITLARMANTLRVGRPVEAADLEPLLSFLEVADDPRLRAEALVALSEAQTTREDLAAAQASTHAAVAAAEAGGDHALRSMALFAEGFALLTATEVRGAEHALERSLELAVLSGDWYIEANQKLRLAFALLVAGSLGRAEVLAREAVEVGQARSEHILLALGWAIEAELAWLRGDFEEVERVAERAAAATRRSGYGLASFFYLTAQFLSRVVTERYDEAAALLTASRDRWPLAVRLTPVVDVARGDIPPIDRSRRLPVARNQFQAASVAIAIQVAVAQRDTTSLEHLEAEVARLEDRGLVVFQFYPVLAPRIRAEAQRILGRADEAGDGFRRAADMAQAIGAAPEEVAAALGRARVAMSSPASPVESARSWAVRARRGAERLGLEREIRSAQAITRLGLDMPDAVAARGGDWRVILITDVVGSSRVSAEIGDIAYFDLVMRHHGLVRRSLERFGGHEFSESGDGLLAWFDSTEAAAWAAFAILDEIAASGFDGPRLQVKIGLAGGEPLFHGGRPYGLVVNRAARVVALARGDQVLVDEAVARSLPPGTRAVTGPVVELRNVGPHRIAELHRVAVAG